MSTIQNRYKDKPFLRLLDMYVIDCIGELNSKDSVILDQITPELVTTYNVEGDWRTIIKTVMKFPDNIEEIIQEAWENSKEVAGKEASPGYFAMAFVDTNFS
ncbi:MAG: hypothetical protein HKN92_06935 [Chitinophagales bacterium]|nr:hypothetical protein [Chitinophagales bacterium]